MLIIKIVMAFKHSLKVLLIFLQLFTIYMVCKALFLDYISFDNLDLFRYFFISCSMCIFTCLLINVSSNYGISIWNIISITCLTQHYNTHYIVSFEETNITYMSLLLPKCQIFFYKGSWVLTYQIKNCFNAWIAKK